MSFNALNKKEIDIEKHDDSTVVSISHTTNQNNIINNKFKSKRSISLNQIGKIELIMGPMFSGKSTELLRNIKRYKIKKKKTIVISYIGDNRYSKENILSTHDRLEYPAIKCSKLKEHLSFLMDFDVIGIDEGQFYADLVEVSELLANNGKIVVIAALNGNFKREPFDTISKIIPKCEYINNITAVCFNCNEEASYSLRLINNESEILIGGEDYYKPVCRACYNKLTNKSSNSNEGSVHDCEIKSNSSS